MAYVCLIVDAFSRRIVGWRVATHTRTEMALVALEMARRARGGRRLVGLIAHSDAGSQLRSQKAHRTLARYGVAGSMGKVNSAGDNVATESCCALVQEHVLGRR